VAIEAGRPLGHGPAVFLNGGPGADCRSSSIPTMPSRFLGAIRAAADGVRPGVSLCQGLVSVRAGSAPTSIASTMASRNFSVRNSSSHSMNARNGAGTKPQSGDALSAFGLFDRQWLVQKICPISLPKIRPQREAELRENPQIVPNPVVHRSNGHSILQFKTRNFNTPGSTQLLRLMPAPPVCLQKKTGWCTAAESPLNCIFAPSLANPETAKWRSGRPPPPACAWSRCHLPH